MSPRRAVDDGAALTVFRQVGLEDLVDVGGLFAGPGLDHHEVQVGAPGAAVKQPQLNAQLLSEVRHDLVRHVRLRRGGQTQDRRDRQVSGLLADEAPHVPIVGPEVVAPPGEAVGLVQHPGADLALFQRPAQGTAPQLFGRDDQDAGVPHPDAFQGVGPLRHGEKAVDGDARTDAPGLEARHLVGHQGHEGGDHHGEDAGLVVPGEGGYLVTEGLAGAGGQDGQRMFSRQGRLDHGLLHRPPRFVGGLRPELVKAEPALEFLRRAVAFLAPGAPRVGARRVPQLTEQESRTGELVPDPGGQHGIAA